MILAVGRSQTSESATQSPNDDILSAALALAYAVANGERLPIISSTIATLASSGVSGTPTAAPAGLTCLKEAAAGRLSDFLSSCNNNTKTFKYILKTSSLEYLCI